MIQEELQQNYDTGEIYSKIMRQEEFAAENAQNKNGYKKYQKTNMEKEAMLLYALTDRSWLGNETLLSQIEKALKGGITLLQLREKTLSETEMLAEAGDIRDLCHRYGVPLIINDSVEVALACDADGVHVGQKDMEAGAVREKLGPDKILGVSARTVEQAVRAWKSGADYLGVGAVFQTGSKADAKTISHETLKEICEAVPIPGVAIGGIGKHNIEQLRGAGMDGFAVISAIFAQPDIEAAARELRSLAEKTAARGH